MHVWPQDRPVLARLAGDREWKSAREIKADLKSLNRLHDNGLVEKDVRQDRYYYWRISDAGERYLQRGVQLRQGTLVRLTEDVEVMTDFIDLTVRAGAVGTVYTLRDTETALVSFNTMMTFAPITSLEVIG